jgi:AsmA protein
MKWVVRLLGIVVVLVVVLVGTVFLLPAERLARIATDQLSATTGRAVTIHGDVRLSIWPVLGVSVNDLEVGNAEWSEQGPMLEAAEASIGVDAMRLLGGDIRITHIETRRPTIRLEQKRDGRVNWQIGDDGGDAQTPTEVQPTDTIASAPPERVETEARNVSIARVDVADATIVYDTEGSERVLLSGVDLSLDWPDPAGPALLTGVLRPAGEPVEIALAVNALTAFIAGDVSPLRASVRTVAGELGLDGRAATSGALTGAFSLTTGNTDAFLRSLGLPGSDLPPKLGRSIAATTEITLTPDLQLALRDLRLDLGGNVITGAADLTLSGTPQINARLDAGDLDLDLDTESSGSSAAATTSSSGNADGSDSSGGGESGSNGAAPPPANGGWPTDPIDASVLSAFNGDIALSANRIDLGDFELDESRVILRNENARMRFELTEVAAYGGRVTGEFVINYRSGLSVGGNLVIAAMQMQPLLDDAIDFRRLTGQGDLRLSFLGSGASIDAIMRSLSGDGALAIGRGTIEGINLDQLLRGGSTSGTTIFDDLTATWTMAGGVLTNRDLLLQLENYRVSGDGNVGLGERTVDYRITPIALRANSGEGLAIPVIFKGPWSDVSIRPDLEAMMDARLEEEKKELERKAKEKLSEKLGVEASEGQSTEDAIKDELKNQLLRKLFD